MKEKKKNELLQDKTISKGKLNSILSWKPSFPSPLESRSFFFLSVSNAWRAFRALFSSATEQWMHVSHATQPRHRWTRHSQRHLSLSGPPPPPHSSHSTWACRARREKGVSSLLLSIWLGFPIVPQKDKKKENRAVSKSLSAGHLSCEKLLIGTCKGSVQSSRQSFPLVRCCLLENNNVSIGPSFKQSSRPQEEQSDQIDLWL